MKVVKLKNYRKKPPDLREQMRSAIMELVREAQAGHEQEQDNSRLMRSARFIGTSASRVHRVIATKWVKVILVLAAIYLLMHWTGISISVFHDLDLIFSIK